MENKEIKEDGTIPRICCSNTITGAIRAIEYAGSRPFTIHEPSGLSFE